MNVLYFSPRVWWPMNTGARLRDYYLAGRLAHYASVTYLGLPPPGERPESIPASLNPFSRVALPERERPFSPPKLLRGALGPHAVTLLNYWSAGIAALLEGILRETRFEVVQIEGVHLSMYVPLIRKAAPQALLASDWHNIESEILLRYSDVSGNLARRLYARRTGHLVERAENALLRACDVHTVASDREREKLQQRAPGATVFTLPNGVDTAFFAPPESSSPDDSASRSADVLFVGSMDYHANVDAAVWMAREAWPAVQRSSPDLKLLLVGRNPTAEVQALASGSIAVTGTVDDVRPYYRRALAVVAPLRVGSGTRLKILEAMAACVPVISTRLGAEGLEVSDQENILLAETPEEFSRALIRVRDEPALRRRLTANARELVKAQYDWASLGDRLHQIHSSASKTVRTV